MGDPEAYSPKRLILPIRSQIRYKFGDDSSSSRDSIWYQSVHLTNSNQSIF